MEFPPGLRDECRQMCGRYPERQGALLPVLHLVQQRAGGLSAEAILFVAGVLDLPPARVAGVVSCHRDFCSAGRGRHLVAVCRSLCCALMGAQEVAEHLRRRLGVAVGETTPDGRFTLREVDCLGSCSTAPVMMVDGVLHDGLTCRRIDQVLGGLR